MFSIVNRLLLVDDSFFGALCCVSGLINAHICNKLEVCLEHLAFPHKPISTFAGERVTPLHAHGMG